MAMISWTALLVNCALPPVNVSPSSPVFFSPAGKRPSTPTGKTGGVETVRAVKESIPTLKLVQNPLVQKWINYFQNKDPQRFQRALNRGYFYQELVERTLAQSGLPKEFYFLPLIESSYVSHARSPARAVGIWQFMPGTGRNYGLKVNRYVDERRDPVRASRAAVKYLRDLYTVFHSWELAMAAYNCGEYRVLRAIMKGDSRDFWLLGQRKLLPRETRNYVPKFIAAVLIGRNPEAFGFRHPRHLGLKRYPEIKAIEVPSPVSLAQVVKVTGWSMGRLKQLNPHLRRGRTPPGFKRYALWLPRSAILGKGQYALLQNQRLKRPLTPPSVPGIHRVKLGENLTLIARRYRTSVARLSRLNRLTSSRLREGQRLALPGKAASASKYPPGQVGGEPYAHCPALSPEGVGVESAQWPGVISHLSGAKAFAPRLGVPSYLSGA